jgi:hypothetical protein
VPPFELLRKAVVASLVVLFLAIGAGWTQPSPPPVFVPDTETDGAPGLQGQTWIGEGQAWSAWLKRLDEDERLAYIRGQTGLSVDPFASRPDQPTAFVGFLLVIENRGDAALSFNPIGCWLTTNDKKQMQYPLGLSDLSFSYRVAGGELPAAYERVRPALYEGPRIVAPGERVSGLLIYRAVDPKTKRYRIDVQLNLPDGNVDKFFAPYRRLSKAELENQAP